MRGCQCFLATDWHVIPHYGIRPDMQVHYFLEFACHPFSLLVTFSDMPLYCSCIVFQKGVGCLFIFTYFPCQTSPCLLICVSVFPPPPFPIFNAILRIELLFPTTSSVTSGPSIHLLIFTCTGGRSAFSHNCCICFLGSPFWSSLGTFWTHFLIYCFMNVVSSVMYCSVRSPPGTLLKWNLVP